MRPGPFPRIPANDPDLVALGPSPPVGDCPPARAASPPSHTRTRFRACPRSVAQWVDTALWSGRGSHRARIRVARGCRRGLHHVRHGELEPRDRGCLRVARETAGHPSAWARCDDLGERRWTSEPPRADNGTDDPDQRTAVVERGQSARHRGGPHIHRPCPRPSPSTATPLAAAVNDCADLSRWGDPALSTRQHAVLHRAVARKPA